MFISFRAICAVLIITSMSSFQLIQGAEKERLLPAEIDVINEAPYSEIGVSRIVDTPVGTYREVGNNRFDRVAYLFEADNVGTLKKVIESGLGWGCLPSHCIKKQIRSGRLAHVQVEEIKHSVDLCFYIKKSDNIRKMSDVFYRALVQQALGN